MEKWCSGREFVAAKDARRRSGSVRAAIADSAIAVRLVAPRPGVGSDALPTAATSGVWRADSIIAIGNVPIGDVMHQLA